MIDLTEIQKKEVINIIVDSYNYSKAQYDEFYQLCAYLQQLYEIKLPDELGQDLEEENPGLLPADAHVGVNELLAQLYDILFSLDPFFRCSGGQNTSERKLRNITSYLKTATYRSKFKRSYTPTLSSAIRFGAGIGYVDVTEISLNVLKRDLQAGGDSTLRYSDIVPENKFLCPTYVPCNLRRFFPDPDNIKRKWGIYQSKATLLDLLEDLEKGEDRKYDGLETKEDIDKLRKTTFPKTDFEEFFDSKDFQSGIMKEYNIPIELLHFRGWIPIPNDNSTEMPEFVDVIGTLANREVLIQFEKNEWHYPAAESFITTTIFPEDDDCIYPVSKVGASMNALLQKFYIRNRQLMALARILGPPYWTDDPSKSFPNYIQLKSGEVVRVSKGSKFEPIKTADVNPESYLEINNLTAEIQCIYGSSQFSANVNPPREQLATGIMVLKGITDTFRKFESNVIVNTGLTTILQRYYDIGRLYLEKTPIQLFDAKEVVELGKEDIDGGDIDIQIQLNDVWNHPIQRQEMLKLSEIYKDDPYVDPVELRRKHFRLVQFTEVEKLVPDPKEKLLPIEKENMMMIKGGIVVPVLPEEPHEIHIPVHAKYKDHPIVAQHLQGHVAMLQEKEKSPNMPAQTGGKVPIAKDEVGLVQQMVEGLNE